MTVPLDHHQRLAARRRDGDRLLPAAVDRGRDGDRVELVEGRLHVVEAVGVDAVIGPERTLSAGGDEGRVIEVGRRGDLVDALLDGELLPLAVEGDAVAEPALERTAERRALVAVAEELVVAASHAIEHVGADEAGRFLAEAHRLARQDRVDDRRDGMTGAGLTVLHQDLERTPSRPGIDHRLEQPEHRPVLEVAQVVGIGLGIRADLDAADQEAVGNVRLRHRSWPPRGRIDRRRSEIRRQSGPSEASNLRRGRLAGVSDVGEQLTVVIARSAGLLLRPDGCGNRPRSSTDRANRNDRWVEAGARGALGGVGDRARRVRRCPTDRARRPRSALAPLHVRDLPLRAGALGGRSRSRRAGEHRPGRRAPAIPGEPCPSPASGPGTWLAPVRQ